jgi:hypothetical protein
MKEIRDRQNSQLFGGSALIKLRRLYNVHVENRIHKRLKYGETGNMYENTEVASFNIVKIYGCANNVALIGLQPLHLKPL